jgi:hypothetical protein
MRLTAWVSLIIDFFHCIFAHEHAHAQAMVYQNIVDSEGIIAFVFGGSQALSATSTSSSSTSISPAVAGVDAHAKDAISNLLKFNPNMRLGMKHDGMKDIWSHPCFKRTNHVTVFILRCSFAMLFLCYCSFMTLLCWLIFVVVVIFRPLRSHT